MMFNGSGRDGQYSLIATYLPRYLIYFPSDANKSDCSIAITDKGILNRLISDISSYDNRVPIKLTLNNSCCSRDL